MKKLLLFVFIIFSISLGAQNNDYLISSDGVGQLKLDMGVPEVEKFVGRKITLKNQNENGYYADTVKTKYKNADITLYFDREYEDETKFHMVLTGFLVTNPLFKTREGLSIGADKMRIISAFENSRLSMGPEYEGEDYHLSKVKYSIEVYNEESDNALIFHLKNKKVVSIEVMRFYGD
jgi:hypothetical protein